MSAESVLLVPGSWHGAWCYEAVADRLEKAGVAVTAIDLPSNDGVSGLDDDAAGIRAALEDIDQPAVVVGHSYGGIAVSEGAAGATNAVGLVYLAAFMLDKGESLVDAMQHQLPDWIAVDEAAGNHIARHSEEVLYGDCPPEVAADAAARLSPQSVAAIDAADTRCVAEPAEHLPDLRRGPCRASARAGGDVGPCDQGAPRPSVAFPVPLAPRRRRGRRAGGAGPLATPKPRCSIHAWRPARAAGTPTPASRARRRARRPSTR